MKYMLLVYAAESEFPKPGSDALREIMDGYLALDADLKAAGAYIDGAPLVPTTQSRTLRLRQNQAMVTDGPFAETREQLAGYYLIEVKGIDEALSWAKRVPHAATGSVEVRALMDMTGPP